MTPLVTDRLPRKVGEFAFMRVTSAKDGEPIARGVVDVLANPNEAVHGMHVVVPHPEGGGDMVFVHFEGSGFTNANGAAWRWDGNRTHPTLSPSIDVKEGEGDEQRTVWHGYLKGGRLAPP